MHGHSTSICDSGLGQHGGERAHPEQRSWLDVCCQFPLRSPMARRNDRRQTLRDALHPPPGYIWLAFCRACRRSTSLPVGALVRRYGELWAIDDALSVLRCVGCDKRDVEAHLVRLCDPGCPRRGW